MSHHEINVWAPATIANLNVGFDGLGCAIEAPGERMRLCRTKEAGVVRIIGIHGATLDFNPERNVAGVAARSVLRELGDPCGVDIEIFKDIMPGSGIGSSAASAAAAAAGVNALLNGGLRPDELLPFALDGEALASGSRHADNVAPALMGGLVLCPPLGPPLAIPVPKSWHLVVLHPQLVMNTSDARLVLPDQVPLQSAVDQSRWLGTFVAACFQGNDATAAFALEDLLVGQYRIPLIPFFEETREVALSAGAHSGGISGSGPSTFWVAMDVESAHAVGRELTALMQQHSVPCHIHVTRISNRGVQIIS